MRDYSDDIPPLVSGRRLTGRIGCDGPLGFGAAVVSSKGEILNLGSVLRTGAESDCRRSCRRSAQRVVSPCASLQPELALQRSGETAARGNGKNVLPEFPAVHGQNLLKTLLVPFRRFAKWPGPPSATGLNRLILSDPAEMRRRERDRKYPVRHQFVASRPPPQSSRRPRPARSQTRQREPLLAR